VHLVGYERCHLFWVVRYRWNDYHWCLLSTIAAIERSFTSRATDFGESKSRHPSSWQQVTSCGNVDSAKNRTIRMGSSSTSTVITRPLANRLSSVPISL
jgi:hypothetical protein